MNKQLCLLSAAMLIAGSTAFASAVIVKQRAKEIARPGSTPPALPRGGAPGVAPAPGGQPQVSATQQQNLTRLQSDIAAIKVKPQITPELKQKFATDLATAAEGATKPSPESVAKLADTLGTVLADKKISGPDATELAKDLIAVLNSANVPTTELTAVLVSAKEILTSIGVTKADVTTIANDIKAIALETQKGAVKTSGK